jgi:diguanylate cyclase (GGDEF)-like protein/PAS domain S-box-containing protein
MSHVLTALKEDETREATLTVGFVSVLLVYVPAAEYGYVNIYGIDITRRRQMEQKVILNAKVFEHASEGIMITDADLRVIDVNPAFCLITGYEPEEILGESAPFLRAETTDASLRDEMWASLRETGSWQGEIWERRKTGERYAQWLSIASVSDELGVVTHYTGMFADITTQKAAEEQLFRMAHYDGLTKLANRHLFQDRVNQAIAFADRTDEVIAILLIDIDGFKLVNDNFGHRGGDQLLTELAQRIGSTVRSSDTVARMGGDEFTVLVRDLKSSDNVASIASKILKRIGDATKIEGHEIFVTGSIGIAIYPSDAGDVETLLARADAAMYRAKQSGKNSYQFFADDMNIHARQRLSYQSRLRRALENGEFYLHYQPQARIDSGELVGIEALARWRNSEFGMVPPDYFIPIAEEAGLIHRLGEHVLRMACRQSVSWRQAGLPLVRVGVNISAIQLRQEGFPDLVASILEETGMPPKLLDLELTESMFLADVPGVLANLERLRASGVTLTIDDFGTKYASLSQLKKLAADRIKIDQSFVQGLPNDQGAASIVSAIIAMSVSFGLEVVAEGVERSDQRSFLFDRGCRVIQGYYCGPPVLPEHMEVILREGNCMHGE